MGCVRGCRFVEFSGTGVIPVPAPAIPGGLVCGKCVALSVRVIEELADATLAALYAISPQLTIDTSNPLVSDTPHASAPMNLAAFDTAYKAIEFFERWVSFFAGITQTTTPPPVVFKGIARGFKGGFKQGLTAPGMISLAGDQLQGWCDWFKTGVLDFATGKQMPAFIDDLLAFAKPVISAFPAQPWQLEPSRPRFCPVCGFRRVSCRWADWEELPTVACSRCNWRFEVSDWGVFLGELGIKARSQTVEC